MMHPNFLPYYERYGRIGCMIDDEGREERRERP